MTQTVFGEARGESPKGKVAVACVILNRARKGGWWGSTPADVCYKRYQFSCWNLGDPNRERIQVEAANSEKMLSCMNAVLAASKVSGTENDPSKGACHYHAASIPPPRWAKGKKPDVVIGGHLFYRGLS